MENMTKVKRKKRPNQVIATMPRKKKRASKLTLKEPHRKINRLNIGTRQKSMKIDTYMVW